MFVIEPPRVTPAVGPRGKRVQTPQAPVRSSPAPLAAPLATPLPVPLPVQPREHTAALAHAAKGVEALGVLVQYLVFRVSITGIAYSKFIVLFNYFTRLKL